MTPRSEPATPVPASYTRPEIRDHGSLQDLTADFDLHFVGSVARVATMAMASHPGQGHGPPDSPPGGGQGNPGGGRPFSAGSLFGGGGIPEIGGDGGFAGVRESEPVALEGLGGGLPTAAGAGGGPGALPGAGASGELPFTGYRAGAVASLGAAMTVAGMTLRSKLNGFRR